MLASIIIYCLEFTLELKSNSKYVLWSRAGLKQSLRQTGNITGKDCGTKTLARLTRSPTRQATEGRELLQVPSNGLKNEEMTMMTDFDATSRGSSKTNLREAHIEMVEIVEK